MVLQAALAWEKRDRGSMGEGKDGWGSIEAREMVRDAQESGAAAHKVAAWCRKGDHLLGGGGRESGDKN